MASLSSSRICASTFSHKIEPCMPLGHIRRQSLSYVESDDGWICITKIAFVFKHQTKCSLFFWIKLIQAHPSVFSQLPICSIMAWHFFKGFIKAYLSLWCFFKIVHWNMEGGRCPATIYWIYLSVVNHFLIYYTLHYVLLLIYYFSVHIYIRH